MLTLQECLKTRSSITAISPLNDGLVAFSTQLHGAKIFSYKDCNVTKNLSIDLLGHKTTAVAISKEYKLLAFANETVLYILNLENKTVIQTIRTNDGTIGILSFVENSPYIIAGTNQGRVIKCRYDGRSQLSRLCSFPYLSKNRKIQVKNNYVSAFAFHGNLMASSGYGGAITLLKMNSLANKSTIETSKTRMNALCFLNTKTLISGNVDGVIQIHTLNKNKVPKNISTSFTNIKHILIMPNPRYVMVSADSNKLILIDIELAKVASNVYLSFSHKVKHIMLSLESTLIVALENNELLKIELPNAQHIKSFILHNALDKAFKLVEKDPMLQGTREHKRLEVLYEKHYAQAVTALINSNQKEAQKLIETFGSVASKKDDINSIFKAFENYSRFKTLYLEKKYALCYAMGEKHPALKRTQQFSKMEERFKEAFSFAQKQILIGREDVAKEILSPYATVLVKKPIIKLVLNQNKDFLEFLKAIQNREYPLIEKLLSKNEIFAQIPTYTALKLSAQNSLEEIEKLINASELQSAVQKIKELQNIPSIRDELKELYTRCKVVKTLLQSYNESDFKGCYEILDSHNDLDELELSQLLEKHWSKLMDQCEEYALKGDVKSIKLTLKDLISVKTRLTKIGDLLRVSFHTKIKALLAKRTFRTAENIIYSYLDIFGSDSEILYLMKSYEKLSQKRLALMQEKDVPRDNWLHSTLIVSTEFP